MELWFFIGLVTPPIHFGMGHTVRMEQPRLVSLSSIDLLRYFLDEYCYLASAFVPLCFPQCYVVNTIRFTSSFQDS